MENPNQLKPPLRSNNKYDNVSNFAVLDKYRRCMPVWPIESRSCSDSREEYNFPDSRGSPNYILTSFFA
uniref:Uncharacterized protein n=1 Tax=Salix viminalis TaxID=40686 RepID=A0A6N2L4G7_SALVM